MKNFAAVLFVLLSLNAFSQIPDYVPTDGLVAWYPFDGNANDESGNGNDGVVYGAELTIDRLGLENSAFTFDGYTHHVGIDDQPQMLPSQISLSAWVNIPSDYTGGNAVGRVIRSRFFGYTLTFLETSQSMVFELFTSSSSSTLVSTADVAVNDDNWHHFVGTFDGQTARLFMDGTQVDAQETAGSSIYYASDGLVVFAKDGNNQHPSTAHYQGDIDDVGFWNRALTESEITLLYSWVPPSGCIDELACNFDSLAVLDDESCVYSGCNDPSACNFNGADICDIDCIYPAIDEDCTAGESLCGLGTYWDDASQTCMVTIPGDVDFNGCLSVEDLLGSLAIYNLCFDADAIAFTCGVDVVNYDGYDYQTAQIGDQCWFAENLRSANYSDGSAIPLLLSAEEWQSQSGPAVTFRSDSAQTVLWGAYYNWESLAQEASVCPIGWHVPSHLEWSELEIALGMDEETAVNFGYRGGIPEVPIALSTSGTNSSGFSAVGAGFRYEHGGWDPNYTAFWTTSEVANPLNAVSRKLFYLQNITAVPDLKTWGLSVRCLRDVE